MQMVDNPVVGVSAHGRRRRRNMSKTRSRCIHHSAHGRNPGTRKREQMSFWHATCASGPVSMLERGAGNCKRLGGVSRRASALGTPVACLNRPASRSRPRGCSRFTYRRELEVLTATLGKRRARGGAASGRRRRDARGAQAGGERGASSNPRPKTRRGQSRKRIQGASRPEHDTDDGGRLEREGATVGADRPGAQKD